MSRRRAPSLRVVRGIRDCGRAAGRPPTRRLGRCPSLRQASVPAASVPLLAALAIVVVVLAACEAGPPPITPGAGRRDPGRAARGQPHRQGLHLPAGHARPGPGRDRASARHQRRARDPRGRHRRRRGPGGLGAAEAATVGGPPGPTPVVSVPPEVSGLRVVVRSGELVDVRWTVPRRCRATPPPRRTGPSGATSPATSPTGCRSRSGGSPRPPHEGAGWYAFAPAAG